jgi:hypothetical protein
MSAALPTYSDENILRDRLGLLNCSTSFLAALAGVPQSRLSLAFNGTRSLDRDDANRLKELTAQLLELVEAFKPVPLALQNPAEVQLLLSALHKNSVGVAEVRQKIAELFA